MDIEIQPPLRGLSEDKGYSKQEPMTTREIVNMAPIDASDGRLNLAQRGGLVRVTASPAGDAGQKIQDLATVHLDKSHIDYAQLGNPTGSSANGPIVTEWEVFPEHDWVPKMGGPVLDAEGNVFVATGPGKVRKYNPDGVEVAAFTPPLGDSGELAGALAIDESGFIYVAVLGADDSSVIYQYKPIDEDRFERVWEEDGITGHVVQMLVQDDVLYVRRHHTKGLGYDSVAAYASASSASGPIKLWGHFLPNYVAGMVLGGSGGLLVAAKPNATRGSSPDYTGSTAQLLSWTPHEFEDADKRVHFWVEPDYDSRQIVEATSAEEGDRVGFVKDTRTRWTITDTIAPGPYDPPSLEKAQETQLYRAGTDRSGPLLKKGIGGRLCLVFDGQAPTSDLPGQFLKTRENTDNGATDFTGSYAVIPSADVATWLLCMVVEFDQVADTATPQIILAQNGGLISGNAENTCYTISATKVSGQHVITFDAKDNSGASNVSNGGAAAGLEVSSYTLPAGVNQAVITIRAGTPQVENSVFRVNGEFVDLFTLGQAANRRSDGVDSGTHIGSPHQQDSDSAGDLHNTLGYDAFTGKIGSIVCVLGKDADAATFPTCPGGTSHSTVAAATEAEKLEGYLAHGFGIAHLFAHGNPTQTDNHPFGGIGNVPLKTNADFDAANSDNDIAAASADGMVVKYDSRSGEAVWVYTNTSGIGYGVGAKDDYVFTLGEETIPGDDVVRKFFDNGNTTDDAATGSWSVPLVANQPWMWDQLISPTVVDMRIRMVVDSEGDVYFNSPIMEDPLDGTYTQILKYDGEDGTLLFAHQADYKAPLLLDGHFPTGIALDSSTPVYRNAAVTGPEFLYTISPNDGQGLDSPILKKHRLVSSVQNNAQGFSPRELKYLLVVNGDIKTFTRAGAVATPTGGAGALQADSPYINSAVLFGKVFYTDGINYKYYDPTLDEVKEWESTSAGKLPPRSKLLASWRGRMVVARTADDAHNFYMSAKDDPFNWDLAPVTATVTQATAGNTAETGLNPDIINALIPYSDDLLIVGGDRSISRLTGDPAAGGQIDLISDITGIAYGSPWCKDPEGVIYFFGSRGGVYAIAPGAGAPVRISERSIERRLQGFDLAAYRVRMVWDYQIEGIRIFQTPNGAGGTLVSSYTWVKKVAGWFEHQFSDASVQPTALLVMDGDDPTDRIVAIGCEDGRIRYFDRDAVTDDGFRIDSYFLVHLAAESGKEYRFRNMDVVLKRGMGGCRYTMFQNEDPELLEEGVDRGELVAGRNRRQRARARGPACWVRFRNAALDERWAFEQGSIQAYPAGRVKVRK